MSETNESRRGARSPDTSGPLLAGFDTAEGIARQAGVTPRTVRRWCRAGMPHIVRGHLRLIDIEKARAWLVAAEVGAPPPTKARRANGRGGR